MSRPYSGRRSLSVREHELFISSLLTPANLDEIDAALDDEIQIDPYSGDPPSKRKDTELDRVLSILDSLEMGEHE